MIPSKPTEHISKEQVKKFAKIIGFIKLSKSIKYLKN